MKKMTGILYYISAALFGVAALLTILCGHNMSVGLLLACIGSAMLCFGAAQANRAKQKQQDEKSENGE